MDRVAVVERGGVALAELQLDDVVGDGGTASACDDRAGSFAQRLVLVADGELRDGLTVVGQADVLDLADLLTRDGDEVAVDEVAGVDQARVDGVAPPPRSRTRASSSTAAASTATTTPLATTCLRTSLSFSFSATPAAS
jgi:hypothetical protein